MQNLKHNCTSFRDLVDAWEGHYQSLSLEHLYLFKKKPCTQLVNYIFHTLSVLLLHLFYNLRVSLSSHLILLFFTAYLQTG